MAGGLSLKLIFIWLSLFVGLTFSSCQYRPRHEKTDNNEVSKSHIEQHQIDKRWDNAKHTIPLSYEDGVYYLVAKVNEVPMKFIFDTGASTISMSLTEAQFLYKQSLLTDEDFLGTVNFQDANGYVSEGLMVNLRSVTIGDVVMYNVKASVVGNQEAPLLLGQSALQRLGKISIDYRNNLLIIE